MISPLDVLLLFLAAFGAGAVNALAGGGSIFTFPVLLAVGVPPVSANITNTVALCPGYVGGVIGQWRDLDGQGRRLATLLPVAAAGGLVGAWLLTRTSDRAFMAIVPALVLGGSLLIATQEPLRRRLTGGARRIALGWAIAPVLLAAIYGGYFGAGLSVIFLALIGIAIEDTLTRLNGLKQAMSLAANVTAALYFAASGGIVWPVAAAMALGALAGGSAGGRLASLVRPGTLRVVVVTGGIVLAAYFALA